MMNKTGMILEGGAVRGLFTSGILDYLTEKKVEFPYVVGVSAGACNALDFVSEQAGRTKACMIPDDKEFDYRDYLNMLKRRSFYDMDYIFDRYPNEIYPFDYDTFFSSKTICELTVTNCITGAAEYLTEKEDKKRLMQICRASSSMPFAAPFVYMDGIPYMDGGLADSIPIKRAMKSGYKKNIVILTRNKGYRKTLSKRSRHLYIAAFRKYPGLVKSLISRAAVYNKTLDYIDRLEEKGSVYVLRPEIPAISKLETNRQLLEEFYAHGYEMMQEKMDEMSSFMEAAGKE